MRQKRTYFLLAHFQRMSLVVKQDEPAYPIDLRLLGTQRQLTHSQCVPDLIQESWLAVAVGGSIRFGLGHDLLLSSVQKCLYGYMNTCPLFVQSGPFRSDRKRCEHR